MNPENIEATVRAKIAIKKANQSIKAAKLVISQAREPQVELAAIRGTAIPTLQAKISSIA